MRKALEGTYKSANTDFQKAHEFWRMWMEGDLELGADGFSLRGKALTEQVNRRFLYKMRQSLAKLLGFFRGMEGNLRSSGMDEATVAEVLRAQKLIREKVKEVDALASRASDSEVTNETSTQGENGSAAGGAGKVDSDFQTGGARTAGDSGAPRRDHYEDGSAGGAQGASLRPIEPDQRAQLARTLDLPQGAVGNLSTVIQNGRAVNVAYVVQEAANARPSHDAQGNPTKGYDQGLQPRDRSLPQYRKQAQNLANELDFDRAVFFPGTQIPATTADLGAPVMTLEGDTLIGNGREIGTRLAYEQGTPASRRYKGRLLREAERFGIDPDAVRAMKEPILKRVIVDAMDRDGLMRFSQESNEGVSMANNAMELAGQDGSRITPGLLSLFDPNYALDAARNSDFVKAYARDVIGGAQANEANLTKGDLARRIRMGIFAYAYGMDETGRAAIERMMGDEADAGGRSISNGLLTVAPIVARMKTDIASGDLHDLDISPAISRAAQDISETLRNRPAKQSAEVALRGMLDQSGMFEGDPLTKSVERFLVENRTNRGAIEAALSNYVEGVFHAGNPKQADMFEGERAKPDAMEIWKRAAGKAGQRLSSQSMELDENGVHPLAKPRGLAYQNSDDRNSDPASILGDLVSRGGGADSRQRWKYGREIASDAGLHAWATARDKGSYPKALLDEGNEGGGGPIGGGGEHTVWLSSDGSRVIKATKPGLYGAQGEDAGAYLQRMALGNRVFGDDVRFEGFVRLPGEQNDRALISQPFRKGRDSTPEELAGLLQSKGFRQMEDGRWVNPVTGVAVWDVLTPGNAITAPDGTVHPIDLHLEPARPDELRKARAQAGIGERLFSQPMVGMKLREVGPDFHRDEVEPRLLDTRMTNAEIAKRAVAEFQSWPKTMVAADGSQILLHNPERGSLGTRVNHMLSGDSEYHRAFDPQKACWIPMVPETLAHAAVRLDDKERGTRIYVREYGDGSKHMVVVRPDGTVETHKAFKGALITQFPEGERSRQQHMEIDWVRPDGQGNRPSSSPASPLGTEGMAPGGDERSGTDSGRSQENPGPAPTGSTPPEARQSEFQEGNTTEGPNGQQEDGLTEKGMGGSASGVNREDAAAPLEHSSPNGQL